MIRAKTSHARSILGMLAALALACALAPGAAAGATGEDSALSPRLQRLAEPGLRSAPPGEQAESLSLAAEGAGSLLRRGRRVLADVRFEGGATEALGALRDAGAAIVHASGVYQTVTVAATPSALPAIGAVPGVESVSEVLAPVTAAACPSGIVSEGDAQLNAADARSAFSLDGSGVTVGILSDSFDQDTGAPTHAAQDVASADLPGPGNPCGHPAPVNVLESFVPFEPGELPGDEGRAMAQIVHDLAPAARIAFASAFNGELAFAAAIEKLARPVSLGGAGAQVIVDDVGYFAEPFFQNGPVGVAVDRVTAAGVSYFSAAGNDNLIDSIGRDIASWEAPAYRPTACPASLVVASGLTPPDSCMDFDPGAGSDNAFGITVAKGATLTLDLQWAESRGGVRSDLDAFLVDSGGSLIEVDDGEGGEVPAGGYDDDVAQQRPVEVFQWENDTAAAAEVRLVVARCTGVCNPQATPGLTPRLKFILLQNGGGVTAIEYPQSSGGDVVGPTIYGHAGASGAIATGAVRFNNSAAPEPFSSRGPVTHYFGPVDGALAAPPIAPTTIAKPDLAATDCGATTFFAQLVAGVWRFCGTSAAAPHAAAVAALIRQADPAAGQAQVRAALTATARPVGT
ncbi:MAG TPA: S8 family serine peptidase, partial [Solirubrobacterales bacterium]|nr:S8 family serine peptidase [Solirubrobacterales bacterium]